MNTLKVTAELLQWYKKHARSLPWREAYEPYKVWISEVMLQQTTMKAVLPYFERFVSVFPTVQTLAQASEGLVLKNWAGLGYYSRARNLHRASQKLQHHFPQSYRELLDIPGFGPYTARAVSSLAFKEPVGVVDGNVIRVLSRLTDSEWEWWKTKDRNMIQALADKLASESKNSRDLNQSLMELGATVCTPQSPLCSECPVQEFCRAKKNKTVALRPLKKEKQMKSIWLWKPEILIQKNKIYLCEQPQIPFLKGQPLPPGIITQLKKKPADFAFKHSITTHEIYVRPIIHSKTNIANRKSQPGAQWVSLERVEQVNPSSVMKKILSTQNKNNQGSKK